MSYLHFPKIIYSFQYLFASLVNHFLIVNERVFEYLLSSVPPFRLLFLFYRALFHSLRQRIVHSNIERLSYVPHYFQGNLALLVHKMHGRLALILAILLILNLVKINVVLVIQPLAFPVRP